MRRFRRACAATLAGMMRHINHALGCVANRAVKHCAARRLIVLVSRARATRRPSTCRRPSSRQCARIVRQSWAGSFVFPFVLCCDSSPSSRGRR